MKKLLLVVLLLLIVAAAVGFLLPADYRVERSLVIGAKPAAVHELVGDLRRWDDWTPWKEMDPTVQVSFGENTKGVGASQTWTGKDGKGSLTFTASDPKKGVEYDMTFDEMPAKGAVRYEEMGETTKVTWSLEGTMGMPVLGGYFALLMPRFVGPSFDEGLAKLKRQVEK